MNDNLLGVVYFVLSITIYMILTSEKVFPKIDRFLLKVFKKGDKK